MHVTGTDIVENLGIDAKIILNGFRMTVSISFNWVVDMVMSLMVPERTENSLYWPAFLS